MRSGSILAGALVACVAGVALATYATAQEPQTQPPPAPQPQAQPGQPGQAPQQGAAPDPKAILASACVVCHDLGIVTESRKSHDDWEHTVNTMIGRGADLNPDEAKLVIDYLARTYPADAPAQTPPAPDAKPQG